MVEREKVDPAVRASVDDLDFSSRDESGSSKTSIDVARTTSMHEIALGGSFDDDRGTNDEVDLHVERLGDAGDDVE